MYQIDDGRAKLRSKTIENLEKSIHRQKNLSKFREFLWETSKIPILRITENFAKYNAKIDFSCSTGWKYIDTKNSKFLYNNSTKYRE